MGYDVNQSLGDHDVTVETVDLVEKGSDLQIHVRLRFKDGEIGDKDLYPLKSEKSAQLTRKAMGAMGFNMDERDLGEFQGNPELLKGRACRAVVQENEWNGNVRNQIAFINAIPKPASKSLLAQANAKLKAAKKSGGTEGEL